MGVAREPGESPTAYAKRAQRSLPRLSTEIAAITSMYQGMAYAGAVEDERAVAVLAKAIRKLN
jgi:hypothetical protein